VNRVASTSEYSAVTQTAGELGKGVAPRCVLQRGSYSERERRAG